MPLEDPAHKWRKNLIDKIVNARKELGLTQLELASMVGVQRSSISRLESGTHNPSLDFLWKVLNALELDIRLVREGPDELSYRDNIYELRLYDTTLMEFVLRDEGLALTANIHAVFDGAPMPLDLELNEEGLLSWLKHRTIPKHRAHVEQILAALGLSYGHTRGILDLCYGLSLNDSYWVVPKDFEGRFADYNLYENEFSKNLSLIAYTGERQSIGRFTTSPELTTGGMLPKSWRRTQDGAIALYKGGTSGGANTGNEPYCEYYASQIAKAMGLHAVSYDLVFWKGMLASTCRLFTDIDTAFIPVGRIVRSGGLAACLNYYAELGDDFLQAVHSMLVFDALIYNEDRHFGNFGVMRDNRGGAVIGPAPIFDNGHSLFNYAMPEDIADLENYARTRFPAYADSSFTGIVKEVSGREQKRQLRRLIDFEFTRHPSINWPEERLHAVEQHLQRRVRELLAL